MVTPDVLSKVPLNVYNGPYTEAFSSHRCTELRLRELPRSVRVLVLAKELRQKLQFSYVFIYESLNCFYNESCETYRAKVPRRAITCPACFRYKTILLRLT